MRTFAIASQKGGVGKSTLGVNLSALAQEHGPTLIVDMDPQGSVTFWNSLRAAIAPLVLPASTSKLQTVLQAASNGGIAFAFVDTAGHDAAGMSAAIAAADYVLIPARPSALDLHAIGATISMANQLQKPFAIVLAQTPARRGFSEPQSITDARKLLEGQGVIVAPTNVSQRAISAHSITAGLAVHELEPDGTAAREYRALWRWVKGRG